MCPQGGPASLSPRGPRRSHGGLSGGQGRKLHRTPSSQAQCPGPQDPLSNTCRSSSPLSSPASFAWTSQVSLSRRVQAAHTPSRARCAWGLHLQTLPSGLHLQTAPSGSSTSATLAVLRRRLQRSGPPAGILWLGLLLPKQTRTREKLLDTPPISLLHVRVWGQRQPQARSPEAPEHAGFGVSSKTSAL